MTADEFNDRYEAYLEKGHYGLDINIPNIVEMLDSVFEDLIRIPGFQYSQIKMKLGHSRFYSNLESGWLSGMIESEIVNLYKIWKEENK